jgi:hypothetical protein
MSTTTRFAHVQKHPRYRLNAPVDVVTASAQIEQMPLENISLGGAFIKTARPAPKGSALRLRLHSADAAVTFGLVGRVVHVIEERDSEKKAHPAGMGVEFEGLSSETQALLERLVEGLVDAARHERARRSAARWQPPSTIVVRDERAIVATLWAQGLDRGALYVESPEAPAFGTRVSVSVGALTLHGDVVHADPGRGFGVQILDLDAKKRAAVAAFADGTAESIAVEEVKVVGPPLGKVLAAARRLFTGIEENDGFSGIGLPDTSTADEVRERCEGMRRLFSTHRPDATPPQAARIEAACRAVARLEPVLLARVAAMRKEAELATVKVDVSDEVRELVTEGTRCELQNKKVEARTAFERALELAPDDDALRQKLASLNAAIDRAHATDLVKSADVFVSGVGMKAEAVKRAREAVRLTKDRDVRLLAVRVFAKAGEQADATLVAEELVDADPRDVLALQALLTLHERAHDWRAAAKAGEALLRLKGGDVELQKRLKKIVEQIRR